MIILGNCECLSKKNEMWKELINYYDNNNLIGCGDFNNLKNIILIKMKIIMIKRMVIKLNLILIKD